MARNYWDDIFANYHPPRYHHPGTCPGCVLNSPRWGTPTDPDRLNCCHCVWPDLKGDSPHCHRCKANVRPEIMRIIRAYRS